MTPAAQGERRSASIHDLRFTIYGLTEDSRGAGGLKRREGRAAVVPRAARPPARLDKGGRPKLLVGRRDVNVDVNVPSTNK